MLRSWASVLATAGLLTACAHPTLDQDLETQALLPQPLAVELRLPLSLEPWRAELEQDIREMASAFPEVTARWQHNSLLFPTNAQNPEALDLTLVVVEREHDAAILYQRLGLSGDPAVPRTFPAKGLAVVPLPRSDRLLQQWPMPPQSWRHSFRHELAHLLSLQDATLRAAPTWFQEGFAEAWCGGRPDQAWTPVWPYALSLHRWWTEPLEEAPAEVRYAALAAQVRQLMKSSATLPWELQDAFQGISQPDVVPFVGLRGREAAWDATAGNYLLITRPSEHVELDLPWVWDGREPLELELQLGRTGEPEAGVVFYAPEREIHDSSRVRLRFSRHGGLALYPEPAGEQTLFQAVTDPAGEPKPGRSRRMKLSCHDGNLVLEADDFRRSVSLKGIGLTFPLQLRLYVRDGALRAQLPTPRP